MIISLKRHPTEKRTQWDTTKNVAQKNELNATRQKCRTEKRTQCDKTNPKWHTNEKGGKKYI